MSQVAYIGQLLGLSETNIISNGCNDYKPETKHLTPELILYIHDDPNGLAFGARNTAYRKKILEQRKRYRLTQRLKQRSKQRSKQYRLKQRSKQYRLKQRSKKGSRKKLK